MKLLLSSFSLLLCLVSSANACCGFGNLTVTWLSATDVSVQFRYIYQPDETPTIHVSSEFQNSSIIVSEIVSVDKVQYDYLYIHNGTIGFPCFQAVGVDMVCVPSNIQRTMRPIVTSFTHIPSSSGDSGLVSLQWEIIDHTSSSTYCTLEGSPLIVFKEMLQPSSQRSTVVRLEEATSYTCYISGWNGVNTGPSINITFTTRPAPPYALVVNNILPDSLSLSWSYGNASDRAFTVTVDKDCIGNGSETTGSGTNLNIDGLSPFTFYCLEVTATISSANVTSLPTSTVARTSEAVPGKVRNLLATPTNTTTMLLSWDEPLSRNGVITGYDVRVGTSKPVDGNTTFFYVGDLDPCRSTDYSFSVAARTNAGRGVWTAVTAATLTPRPEIPEIVQFNRQNYFITWTTDTPTNCIQGTRIHFQPVHSLEDPVSFNSSYTGIDTILFPSILKQGVAYNVSLRSYGSGGASDPTQPILSPPVISSSLPYTLGNRTNYLQIQFNGVGNCAKWNKTTSPIEVADALCERMSSICPDNDRLNINSNSLTCVEANPLFRFQISQTNEQFSSCLEYWYASNSSYLLVVDQLLLVDKSCDKLYISSLEDPACMMKESSLCLTAGPIAGGFIGGIVAGTLLATFVIVIALLTCFRRKIVQRNTQKTGIGSCTVLDTVGTNYKPKKAKPNTHHQHQVSHSSSDEDNYEMVPYQGDGGAVASDYVDNPTNNSAGATKQTTFDPDYEVPEIFAVDRQKATAGAALPSSHYEPIGLDTLSPVKHLPLSKKSSLSKQTNMLPNFPGGARVPFIKPAPAPTLDNLTTPKPLTMPALPTKQEDSQLSTIEEATKKKLPLVPKLSQSSTTDQMSGVISKAKMFGSPKLSQSSTTGQMSGVISKAKIFGSVLVGPQPPKPKPKPKGKEASAIPCADNSAYQLPWKPK